MDFVEIGGKEYRVEFNWNALGDYLEEKGCGLQDLQKFTDMGANDMTILAWAGIKEGERLEGRKFEMSPRDLGVYLTGSDATAIIDIFSRHYLGKDAEKGGTEEPAASKKKLRWFIKK